MIWIDLICLLGDPCPSLYTPKGQGYKENIQFGTIIIQCRALHVFILRVGPSLMVRPIYTHEGMGGLLPHNTPLSTLARH
jgi:hypothetical protein